MYIPVEDWFLAFVLTVAVEAGVVWLLLRRRVAGLPRLGVLVLGANLATHPVVWFVLTQLLVVGTLTYTTVAEGWAAGAETAIYWAAVPGVSGRRAAVVGAAANLGSFIAGRALRAIAPGVV